MTTVQAALPPQPVPVWVPVGYLARPRPCGRYWDAVTINYIDGYRVIGALGAASGAVIEDPENDRVTWLVHAGTAAGWDLPGVTVLGHGHTLLVPPLEPLDTATLRWAIRPGPDPLTCHRALYEHLVVVTGGRPDPRILSTYTSPECLWADHDACTKGEVPATPPTTTVVEEPCCCRCHRPEDGR
ncbi:hypothetical protein [Streptomyces sp. URMC 129]|uniref:hypothetical protein n=1 Tax=Streptomyces sp. URMC 129 TaxID=3423407 RepID=UPI003F1A1797